MSFLSVLSLALCLGAPVGEAEQLVARLGSPDWHEREAASHRLVQLGRKAGPALEKALQSPDPEVRHRARIVLDIVRWEVPVGLSDQLAAVLRHYKMLPERERMVLLGELTRALGRDAVPVLRQALREEGDPNVRSSALRHLVALDREAARRELSELANRSDRAPWAWAALAQLLSRSGQGEAAMAAYEKARGAGNREKPVAEALARLYTTHSRWAKARDLFAELVEAEPDNPYFYLQLGRCHHMLGEEAAAEAVWRKLIKTTGNDPNAYIWLASAYEGIGRREKALAALQEGVRRHPAAFDLLRRLAETLAASGRFDEALATFEEAQRAAQSPYQRRALNMELATRLRNAGKFEEYLRAKETQAARLDDEIVSLLKRLVAGHIAAGETVAARRALVRLLNLYPMTAHARWAAGKLRELDAQQ